MKTCLIFCFLMMAVIYLYPQADSIMLYYRIDEHVLDDQHKSAIDSFAARQDIEQNLIWSLTASADYLGSRTYNSALSQRRLEHAAAYLELKHTDLIDSLMLTSRGELLHPGYSDPGGGVRRHRTVTLKVWPDTTEQATLTRVIANARIGDRIRLMNLNFIGGRHFLLRSSVPELKNLLKTLQAYPNLKIEIQGHVCCIDDDTMTDGFDKDTRTFDLSVNRARNIYEYLVRNGIDSSRLSYRGFGGSRRLVMPEDTDAAKTANRRVEILIKER